MSAGGVAPDADLVARFRGDVMRLVPGEPPLLALAVSGGPDSMAMLVLAAAAFPGRVTAATVDHGLRRASGQEAAMVAGWGATAGIAHATLPVAHAIDGENLHAWARRERYAALSGWAKTAGATVLATAHHADDQAETFLMRAARGAGLAGLSAVRARREEFESVELVRPLLGWRRCELRAVAMAAGAPFVDDPSNDDDRFDRARFRAWLAQAPWFDPLAVARSAAHLAEADADFRAMTAWLWATRRLPAPEGEVLLDVTDIPREIRRRLARQAIESVGAGPRWTPASNVEPLLDALDRDNAAMQGGVMASAHANVWHFRVAPPRRHV